MNRTTVGKGMLIAGAAAALILAGNVIARAGDKTGGDVHCAGINACKGQGACAGADNSCKGKNGCKGKGFVKVSSADECVKKGGKVVEPKKM
ncbi:MAG: hypothetical protein HY271_16730 [Deltaproteobacteria bacterium]|nr:hypothetical protein [Deltaproteobacteria bacterium]